MTPELTKVLQDLRGITNNFGLTGDGVAGNLVEGFTVKSTTSGGSAGVTPPIVTGACCIDADCFIVTESECTDSGGTYQGDDTVCDPSPCGGACCYFDGSCEVTSEDFCNETSGIFRGVGVGCDPNPCAYRCCDLSCNCSIQTFEDCSNSGGVYWLLGADCTGSDPCCDGIFECCPP